ncbi:hypothetical protein Tco_1114550 [Tanacetum coccineum]|uniref:Uncharacterized protein n=1 Tax=Tanacetum coccineum TaxID=301880 RepID=A0ABQ5IVE3_9ASTR
MRQKFKPNTQPPRTGNNKQVKSKEKQVTQSAYQPKKKDVNEGQGKSDGRETQNEGVDKINVEKQNCQKQASPKKGLECSWRNLVSNEKDDSGMTQCMEWDEIRGMDKGRKEVKKYIDEESLSICHVIETHLKAKSLQRIRYSIFGDWEWISNMQFCDKGCRIMLG